MPTSSAANAAKVKRHASRGSPAPILTALSAPAVLRLATRARLKRPSIAEKRFSPIAAIWSGDRAALLGRRGRQPRLAGSPGRREEGGERARDVPVAATDEDGLDDRALARQLVRRHAPLGPRRGDHDARE